MRSILILFLFLLPKLMSAQVTLAGTTQDAETGKPVPYVNIGVLNQNIGTVSGPDGSFTLVVHNENLQDTLKLSSVGYTPLLLVVDAAAQKLTTGTYLPLQPHVMELSEVVVEGNRPNAVLLGNKNRTELLQVGFREATLGHEVGIRYKVKHPDTFLKTFRGYILNNNSETMRFRLNFYTVKKGWPGEKLVQQNILFTLDQEEGVFEVDLTPYSIFMDEDFFCTIELIENQNQDEVIMFAGTWLGTKMPFRETSQGKWDTYRSVSLGFQIDAAY